MKNIPIQFKHLFWDVGFKKLNANNDKFFITERLVEKGNFDSLKWLLDKFSNEEIISVIEKSPNISFKKKNLVKLILE